MFLKLKTLKVREQVTDVYFLKDECESWAVKVWARGWLDSYGQTNGAIFKHSSEINIY